MIQSMHLSNFRGFEELNVANLNRMNLITGRNNCGKSSLLEAIFLYYDHSSPDSSLKIASFRKNNISLSPIDLWSPLFYRLEMDRTISFEFIEDGRNGSFSLFVDKGNVNGVEVRNGRNGNALAAINNYPLNYSFSLDNYFEKGKFILDESGIRRDSKTNRSDNSLIEMRPARYINSSIIRSNMEIVEWVSRLEINDGKDTLINAMAIIEPGIRDIVATVISGKPELYIKTKNATMPLSSAGDGLYKLMYIILAIMEKKNSVILIDEIETGLHYSMFGKLWEILNHLSKENGSQLFITTHSYEAVQAAVEHIGNSDMDEFSLYRVSKQKEKTLAMYYDRKTLKTALESEMDIR